jgi:steroid 5-alpha reductase family enzyme
MFVATVLAGPGGVLPLAAAGVAVLILLTWLLSLKMRDASIIDPVWGPAFVLVALIAALDGSGAGSRRWLLLALTAAWGIRLGVHLTRRKLAELGQEDRRYAAMRKVHQGNFASWSLTHVYLVQGVLVVIISLPIQAAAQRHAALSWAIVPGLVFYTVGLGFEAIGDEQLRRFKSDRRNDGLVMDRGLWRYTRHPNYFGDACLWWGLWLVALQAGGTWWTAVGPAVMSLLLVKISGKKLLEGDIAERRPGYVDYVMRTSGFIPLPPHPRRGVEPLPPAGRAPT